MILRRLTTAVAWRARDRGQLAHDAVDADAHEEPPLLRGEVDVGGAEIERLRDRPVDEDDGRRVVVGGRERSQHLRSRAASVTTSSIATRHRRGAVIAASIRSGPAHTDADRHPDGEPKLVGEHDVRRIGDRNEHGAVVEEADRQRAVAPGEALGQHQRRLDLDRRRGRDRRTRARAARRGRVRSPSGSTKPLLEQDLAEALIRSAHAAPRAHARAAPRSRLRRGRAAFPERATGSEAF